MLILGKTILTFIIPTPFSSILILFHYAVSISLAALIGTS